MLDGQLRPGASLSFTVNVTVHPDVFPQISVTVKETGIVLPCETPVYTPAAMLCVTAGTANPQLSEGMTNGTKLGMTTSQLLLPVVFSVKGGVGQVKVGG